MNSSNISLWLAAGLTIFAAVSADAAANVTPDPAKYYRIRHVSGLYATDGGFSTLVADKTEDNTQVFRFIPVEGAEGVYNIQRVSSGMYCGSDNKWTSTAISHDTPLAQHKLALASDDNYITIRNVAMNGSKAFWGTDDYTSDKKVYTDKTGNDATRHFWVLEECDKYAESSETPKDLYADHPLADGDARADAYDGYRLVFAEEFSTDGAVNHDIWQFETGFKRNNEDQYYYGDKNCYVQDGVLVIEARDVSDQNLRNPRYSQTDKTWPSSIGEHLTWTSGSMQTKGGWNSGYTWKYGIYEVRAKVPQYVGCWPAIWSTGMQYEWPYGGEIDILEYYGRGIHGNVAWGGTQRWNAVWNSAFVGDAALGDGWGDEYHTWRMLWDEDHIELWCDDILVNNVDLDTTVNGKPSGSFDHSNGANPYRTVRQMLWLNLAMGGNNGGSLASTPRPSRFLVDYARVYQKIGTDGLAKYHVDDAISEPTFTLKDGESGINGPIVEAGNNTVLGVYNLQGIRVADSIEEMANTVHGVYIVKGTLESSKIIL